MVQSGRKTVGRFRRYSNVSFGGCGGQDELPSEATSGEPRKRLWLVMVVRTAAAAGPLPYLVSSQCPRREVIGMVLAADRTTGV